VLLKPPALMRGDNFSFPDTKTEPPNTSVLFSVPRELLRDGRSIVIQYQFLHSDAKGKLADYGKKSDLRFKEANLKNARGSGTGRRVRQ
jgi:hypothetical protein